MTKIRVIKPLKQRMGVDVVVRPPEYGGNRGEFEAATFDAAVKFTVSRKAARQRGGRVEFDTAEFTKFPDALRAVGIFKRADGKLDYDRRNMVYAVSAEGRSFMIPCSEWMIYLKRWKGHHDGT